MSSPLGVARLLWYGSLQNSGEIGTALLSGWCHVALIVGLGRSVAGTSGVRRLAAVAPQAPLIPDPGSCGMSASGRLMLIAGGCGLDDEGEPVHANDSDSGALVCPARASCCPDLT